MTEFALLIDGVLREIRQYGETPADIPHKKVSWHPVVRDEGATAFAGLVPESSRSLPISAGRGRRAAHCSTACLSPLTR
jgi:hypothetical protein